MTAVAPAAGAARRRRAAVSAVMPAGVAAALTAIAVSRGRSVIHSSSPSTTRVDHACSSAGFGKITGLAAIQAPTIAAWLHRRVHRGTSTSGVLSQRVQALHGLEWRAKTLCLRSAKRRGVLRSFPSAPAPAVDYP